jgi:hypothetical protein
MSEPSPNIHQEGTEPSSFTPALGRHHQEAAKEVCSYCPVRLACQEHVLIMKEHNPGSGSWAGLGPNGRKEIARQRRREAA